MHQEGKEAAGLLLRMFRIAADRTQAPIARLFNRTEATIGHWEKGELPSGTRPYWLRLAAAYELPPRIANGFLALVGESELAEEERQHLAGFNVPNSLRFLVPDWDVGLRDRDLQEFGIVLSALANHARHEDILRRPASLMNQYLGSLVGQALAARSDGRALPPALSGQLAASVEGFLNRGIDELLDGYENQVRSYIAGQVRDQRGTDLLSAVTVLREVAPRRLRQRIAYLVGLLYEYAQNYTQAAQELSQAMAETSGRDNEMSSLLARAEIYCRAGLVHLSLGSGEDFGQAEHYLQQAETLYQQVDAKLPHYAEENRRTLIEVVFQRARALTWGARRQQRVRFDEAEVLYKQILEAPVNQTILQKDSFLSASVYKERGDNLRLRSQEAGATEIPSEARAFLQEAVALYGNARLGVLPATNEQVVECYINAAYIHGLLGQIEQERRERSRALRIALKAREHFPRQVGHLFLQLSGDSTRSDLSRLVCAYMAERIASVTGNRYVETRCRETRDEIMASGADVDLVLIVDTKPIILEIIGRFISSN